MILKLISKRAHYSGIRHNPCKSRTFAWPWLVQSNQTLRIWPLDQITSSDLTAAQRRAQSELGLGKDTLRQAACHIV